MLLFVGLPVNFNSTINVIRILFIPSALISQALVSVFVSVFFAVFWMGLLPISIVFVSIFSVLLSPSFHSFFYFFRMALSTQFLFNSGLFAHLFQVTQLVGCPVGPTLFGIPGFVSVTPFTTLSSPFSFVKCHVTSPACINSKRLARLFVK